MHYCLMLLRNEFPTDSVIEKALEPYSEEKWYETPDDSRDESKRPLFLWDYWQIGGRYNGKLKLKCDIEDDSSEYRWRLMAKEPRAGRLFRSYLLETMRQLKKPIFFEDDYLASMGARDGFVIVDGGKIADMLNFADEYRRCFCAIDPDGNAYARESWDGNKWIDDPAFEDKIKSVCENKTDGYVVFIDIHN